MDDGFELSEEDFLKAALDIEAATQKQQQKPAVSVIATPQDCILPAAEGAINRRPLVTSSSIFNDSDDSDIDLSLSIGHSENPSGYTLKQTGNHAFKAFSLSASNSTSSSNQDLINAKAFVNMASNMPKLRSCDSFSNMQLKSQSDEVIRSSAYLPLNSGIKDGASKQVENKVVCQASKFSSRLDRDSAVSNPQPSAVVSRSSFPLVKSDENLTRKRKFPGPAGVLPTLRTASKLDNILSDKPSKVTDVPTSQAAVLDVPCTQSQETQFQSSAWMAMKEDLGNQAELILTNFCISSIIQKANAKRLPCGKVPVLCAVIDGVKVHSADASVTLRDPSGVIYGTVHRELLRDHLELIQTGTVIVLRQVGVLCPSGRRNFYLNITPNNVVGFYSLEESDRTLRVKVRELTEDDFLMLTKEPARLNSNCPIASPELEKQHGTVRSAGSLFCTVPSNSAFNQCNRTGSFSNPRMTMHPLRPEFSFRHRFESPQLNTSSPSTVANSKGRSFIVPSVLQQPHTSHRTPATPSSLQPALSHVPDLMPHRTPPLPLQLRPASVQPVARLSPSVPHLALPNTAQSNLATGWRPFKDITASTLMHSSSLLKENLLDNRNNSQSSQSTFCFKKLSAAKSLPSCSSTGSTTDPVKETTSTTPSNSPCNALNSNDFSDYIDDSLLSDLSSEFFSEF